MNILFNALVCGLGNCGGARTILLCQQELIKLGHRCSVAARVDNFMWFNHKQVINYIPNDTDVIINVSAKDYMVTRNSNVPKKYAWWRAHENWSNTEGYLRRCYLDKEVKNIVNSVGLQKRLLTYDAESVVVYQGVDIDEWKDLKLRPKDKIRIGCLYSSRDIKRWKDFVELSELLGNIKYEYVAVGTSKCKDIFLSKYLQNPSHDYLNSLYSSCHIWMSPVTSEGLHNPPMEAALCGALVLCSDCITNGMILDYVFNNTAMIYNQGSIEQAARLVRYPNWSLVSNMQEHIKSKIGTRRYNMMKLIKILEEDK